VKRFLSPLGLIVVVACNKGDASKNAPDARVDVCPNVSEGKLADRGADAEALVRATVEESRTVDGKVIVYARATELLEGTSVSSGTLLALGGELKGALATGDVIGLACSPGGTTLERSFDDAGAKAARACMKVARASGGGKVDELVKAKVDVHGEMGRVTCARVVMCGKERRGDLAHFAAGVLGSARATSGDQQDALELYDITKTSFVREAGCETVAEVLVPDKETDEINVAAVHTILTTAVHPADDRARRAALEKLFRLHSRMGEKLKPLIDKQDTALRKDARGAFDRMDAGDKVAFSSLKRVLPTTP
jgi:hypothetical protein